MSENRASPAAGCLTLFALPFLGMGLFFVILSLRNLDNPRFHNPWMGVIAGSIFALFGALMISAGLQGTRALRRLKATQEAHPSEPWLWRDDWAQSRALGQSTIGSALTLWLFAIFWNAISWVAVWAVIQNPIPAPKRWAYLLVALFPAVGLLLLGWAILKSLRRFRFGTTVVQLQTVPAALGCTFHATIEVSLPQPLPHGINLVLSCVNRVSSGSGKDRSTSDHIRWQERKNLTAAEIPSGPAGSTIPIAFNLPRDMPASSAVFSDNRVLWLLRAEADIPGANFDETYEIPVFETRNSPKLDEWTAAQAVRERSDPAIPPVRPNVIVSASPEGGTEFYFPPAKNLSAAIGVTLFALLFNGAEVGILYLHAPFLFPVVFGFFSLLLLLVALNLWFASAWIVVNSSGLTLRSNFLGHRSIRHWNASQVQSIYPRITMQTGGGSSGTPYYTVILVVEGAREHSLGNAIRDHNEAEWLCRQLREILNLKTKSTSGSL